MECKESSIYYFENRFRAIVHFMEMNGYEAYTYPAYTAYLETITGGREYHELQSLEPVFISENAGWTRNFAASQGKKSRESFVDFKIF